MVLVVDGGKKTARSRVGLREWHLSREEKRREGAGVEGRRDGSDDGGDPGVRSGKRTELYWARQPAPCEAKGVLMCVCEREIEMRTNDCERNE